VDPSTSIDPLLGRVIAGKLELLQVLGNGAMGTVYRAQHLGLAKNVAIKVLAEIQNAPAQHALRFKAEARAASRLDHPNVVQILDFGEDSDGLLYLAMEFLDGKDLQAVLRDSGRLETLRVAWIMSQVLSALAAAHRKGVIHRDMKPGNIMLTTKAGEDGMIADFVKVCDFGLAKILDVGDSETSSGPVTRQGAIFGTPAYMSPEQARGDPLDPRSDIYSCGVIIYKMITGRTPFRAETPTGVLMKHISENASPMSEWVDDVDPRIERIVERCMIKDRNERYQDAREPRDELRKILEEAGMGSGPITSVGSAPWMAPSNPAILDPSGPMARTVSRRRSVSNAPTEMPATVGPSMAATEAPDTKRMEAMPLQTLPPANESQATAQLTAPPSKATMIAAIPGAIALLLIGGLTTIVLTRDKSEAPPPPPAAIVEAPPPAPPVVVAPPPPPPIVEAPPPPPPAKVERTTRKRAKPEAKIEAPRPPPIEAPPPIVVAPPPPPEPVKPVEPPPPAKPPPPAGPPKLVGGWSVALDLSDLEIKGAISKTRTKDGLARHLDAAKACLRTALGAKGIHTSGSVRVRAAITVRGTLKDVTAQGVTGAETCLVNAFAPARVPAPDTGASELSFVLAYETKP
jgi:eukaryotic-like serine/threonine-protein kinase